MVSYKVAELKLNCCKFVSGVWQLSDTLMNSAMHAEPRSQSSKFNKNIQQLYVGNRLNTKQRFSLYQETCSGSKMLRVASYTSQLYCFATAKQFFPVLEMMSICALSDVKLFFPMPPVCCEQSAEQSVATYNPNEFKRWRFV